MQIGCHTDWLWDVEDEALKRSPQVVRTFAVTSASMRVGSPFGGLIYVLVDEGLEQGVQPVTFSGAVKAPWFVKGRTSNAEWEATVK